MARSDVILLFGSITRNLLSYRQTDRDKKMLSRPHYIIDAFQSRQTLTSWNAVVSDLMLCFAMYLCKLQPWYCGFSRPKSLIRVPCSGILRMSSQSFSVEDRISTQVKLSHDSHMTYQRGIP